MIQTQPRIQRQQQQVFLLQVVRAKYKKHCNDFDKRYSITLKSNGTPDHVSLLWCWTSLMKNKWLVQRLIPELLEFKIT
jgi:hypothetical protein